MTTDGQLYRQLGPNQQSDKHPNPNPNPNLNPNPSPNPNPNPSPNPNLNPSPSPSPNKPGWARSGRPWLAALSLTLLASVGIIDANALPLPGGAVIFPTGISIAGGATEQAGAVINDNTLSFSGDPTPATPFTNVGGAVQNRVVLSDQLGTLIFSPRIRDPFNIDGGQLGIVGFATTGWAGWNLDVDFRLDQLGDKGPTSVSRSADGNLLTFRYAIPLLVDALAPGLQEESFFPSLVTNATAFVNAGRMQVFAQLIGQDGLPGGALLSMDVSGVAIPDGRPVSVASASPLALLGIAVGLVSLLLVRQRNSLT